MLRRNPDLIATIAVAVYLALGSAAGPSVQFLQDFHRQPALREEIRQMVREGVHSLLRELTVTFEDKIGIPKHT